MATNSNKAIKDKRRAEEIQRIFNFLTDNGEDVGYYETNKITYPIVLENGDEYWVSVTVSIPEGAEKRTEPFDGYERREYFESRLKAKAEKAEAAKKKKAEKIERDRIRREKEKIAKAKREEG